MSELCRKDTTMKRTNLFAFDTETSVYKGQKETEIWSVEICPIRTKSLMEKGMSKPEREDCIHFTKLSDFLLWCDKQGFETLEFYVHNLKFDGTFMVDWLMKHGYIWYEKTKKKDPDLMKSFSALIGDMGQWYSFTITTENGTIIKFKDSLKLINSSLADAAKGFGTEHQKLEMEYKGERHEGCYVSPEEMKYIENDVLVLSELIEALFEYGFGATKSDKKKDVLPLTDAGAAKAEYLDIMPKMYCEESFINIANITHDPYTGMPIIEYGANNADAYIRKSYRGGWCYTKKDRAGIHYTFRNVVRYCGDGKWYIGIVADVNSLYPSMMHSESGNYYPIGIPHFVKGKEILKCKLPKKYSFIRLKCRFKIKRGYLPFIQIKGNKYYSGNEMLEDSRPTVMGQKVNEAKFEDGSVITDRVEMTLTCTDYELFHKHYHVSDEEIIDGCWFWTDKGMFDSYINKWMEIKKKSKGVLRAIAKIMLNSLYGRFALAPENKVRVPILEDGIVKLELENREDKEPWYIPIGSAITSYARRFTITAAQKNYDCFCYADTDSIHCLCSIDDVKGIKIHPKNLCCWKIESFWDEAVFVRPKTYIEHVTHEDEKAIDDPYDNVKCAGMPQTSKNLLIQSFHMTKEEAEKHKKMMKMIGEPYGYDEIYEKEKFLSIQRKYDDFKDGLKVPGKLMPVHIPGGIILADTLFTMRKRG